MEYVRIRCNSFPSFLEIVDLKDVERKEAFSTPVVEGLFLLIRGPALRLDVFDRMA